LTQRQASRITVNIRASFDSCPLTLVKQGFPASATVRGMADSPCEPAPRRRSPLRGPGPMSRGGRCAGRCCPGGRRRRAGLTSLGSTAHRLDRRAPTAAAARRSALPRTGVASRRCRAPPGPPPSPSPCRHRSRCRLRPRCRRLALPGADGAVMPLPILAAFRPDAAQPLDTTFMKNALAASWRIAG
jgi:hypothetical protein